MECLRRLLFRPTAATVDPCLPLCSTVGTQTVELQPPPPPPPAVQLQPPPKAPPLALLQHRSTLWEVVEKPAHWNDLSHHSKVCEGLILMTEWLWRERHESASILIFVAEESEVFCMQSAILNSAKLNKVRWFWEVLTLGGACPRRVESEVRDRLADHVFVSTMPAVFLVLTAGKVEDGWTPRSNGMINCSEMIDLDDLGFLSKSRSDEVSDSPRVGRGGRVEDRLILHLGNSPEGQ